MLTAGRYVKILMNHVEILLIKTVLVRKLMYVPVEGSEPSTSRQNTDQMNISERTVQNIFWKGMVTFL